MHADSETSTDAAVLVELWHQLAGFQIIVYPHNNDFTGLLGSSNT